MSGSIQSFTSAGLISQAAGLGTTPAADPHEFAAEVSNTSKLVVNGNTVDTGRYLIIASTASTHGASSSANDGQITIYDKQTNTYVNVWGDPHLTASDGNKAEFQQDGLTITLADGTDVEIEPTALSNGVSHIAEVAVTKNGQTVEMTNFEGQAGSQVTVSKVEQGTAHTVDASMGNLNDTVLAASTSDVGALSTLSGYKIVSPTSQMDLDGLGGGVGMYFNNFNAPATLAVSAAASTEAVAAATSQAATAVSEPITQAVASSNVLSAGFAAPVETTPASAGVTRVAVDDILDVAGGIYSTDTAVPSGTEQPLTTVAATQTATATSTTAVSVSTAASQSASVSQTTNPSAGVTKVAVDDLLDVAGGIYTTSPAATPSATAAPVDAKLSTGAPVSSVVTPISVVAAPVAIDKASPTTPTAVGPITVTTPIAVPAAASAGTTPAATASASAATPSVATSVASTTSPSKKG